MERGQTGPGDRTVEGHGAPDSLGRRAQTPPGRVLVREKSGPGVRGKTGGHSGTLPEPAGERPGAFGRREDPDPGAGSDATGLPLRMGKARRRTATCKRKGTTCLLAALSVHEGQVTAKTIDSNNHAAFLSFLKRLYRENPGRHLHVIVDTLSVHKHRKVREWIEKRRRLTLHFTPTYASWLNQIEIWFSIFSRDVLKGGVWKSKKELVDQILLYIRKYNKERARPFKWTYTGKPLTV
ncbi:MAG: IS630 family transposase [Leptospirillum sp.]